MKAKLKGRAVVLALVLALILSVPVLAAVNSKAWEEAKVFADNTVGRWEQYQWVMEQMELEIQNAVPNSDSAWKPHLKPLPVDDSSVAFGQYLWALQEMEKSIQEAVPNK